MGPDWQLQGIKTVRSAGTTRLQNATHNEQDGFVGSRGSPACHRNIDRFHPFR